MGFGEEHWNRWLTWYRSADAVIRRTYKSNWPESVGWEGFYDFIEAGTPPPHLVERERRIEASAIPPHDDEREIRDPDRIRWMLRDFLRRPKTWVRLAEYGSRHEVFCDKAGLAWCLAIPSEPRSTDVYLYRYDGDLIGADNLIVERPLR
jgi:hypothetical protein